MFRRKTLAGILIAAMVTGGAMSVAAQQGYPPLGQDNGAVTAALEAAAAETGLDSAEILAQLRDGLTLADIVTAEGGEVQVVIDAAVAALTERVDNAVENGLLADARADRLRENLESAVADAVNGEWRPGILRGRGMMRFGERRGDGGRGFDGLPGRHFDVNGLGLFGGRGGFVPGDFLNGPGIDAAAVLDALRSGSTVREAISAAGGDPQVALDAAIAEAEDRLAQAVENGRLSQEDADARLADIGARLTEWLDVSPLENRIALQIVPGALQLAAEQTGLTVAELRSELAGGATLGDVLAEHGVDEAAFVETLVERAAARLNVQVVDGRMTRQQADAALADIRARIEVRLNMSGGDMTNKAV